MILIEPRLLSCDPIFQLNMVLWSLKDLPIHQRSYQIRPVLREAGYYLVAIDRKIILPSDVTIRQSLMRLVTRLTPPVPDIWLRHINGEADLIIELKSQGFGLDSSNVNQALKLLVASADLSLSVGNPAIKRPGHLTFITVLQDAKYLLETIDALKAKLDEYKIPSSPASVIGLSDNDSAWIWESPNPSCLPQPLKQTLSEPISVLRKIESVEEMLPLLFIPWIPDSGESYLHSIGLSVLTGRVLCCVLAEINNAEPPVTLTLRASDILEEATYGVFSSWKEQERHSILKKVIDIISDNIQSTDITYRKGEEIDIDIASNDTLRTILQEIEQIDVSDSSRNLETIRQPSLF